MKSYPFVSRAMLKLTPSKYKSVAVSTGAAFSNYKSLVNQFIYRFVNGCADKMMYYLLAASQGLKRKGCRVTTYMSAIQLGNGAQPSGSAEKSSAFSCNTTKSL